MSKQTTHTILMVKPVAFSYNEQTAVNNYFQNKRIQRSDFQEYALHEFNELVKLLSANGIRVIVVDDTFVPHKPDSIFPNNWISFHEGGQVVLYPMFAENRRKERRNDIINIIEENGIVINNVDNFSFWEEQNLFLEGTGSMVLDRVNKIAYAALSDRTAESLFLMFCEAFDYKPICFIATHLVNDKRLPVYHTNVMMCIASTYAVICDQSIDDHLFYTIIIL